MTVVDSPRQPPQPRWSNSCPPCCSATAALCPLKLLSMPRLRTIRRAFLALPVVAWVVASYVLAGILAGPLMLSGQLIDRRLYWAIPFVPAIWPYNGPLRGRLMSLVFR